MKIKARVLCPAVNFPFPRFSRIFVEVNSTATSSTIRPPSGTAWYWWALAWLGVAVGVCFRVCHLGRESLWFDEGYTAWMVSHSPGEIIRLILADTAPPLYYLLLHGWTEVFGRSEIALRSLSATCSILTLLVGFGIARRMLRKPAAVAAAMWLLSFSFLQMWYAREARAYALMGLMGVAAFDWLQRHLAAGHRRWLIPLALLIAAEMYTHNMMAPYAMGLVLAWLVLPSEHSMRRRIAEMSLVTGVAAALYLPWAIGGLPHQMDMILALVLGGPSEARPFPDGNRVDAGSTALLVVDVPAGANSPAAGEQHPPDFHRGMPADGIGVSVIGSSEALAGERRWDFWWRRCFRRYLWRYTA